MTATSTNSRTLPRYFSSGLNSSRDEAAQPRNRVPNTHGNVNPRLLPPATLNQARSNRQRNEPETITLRTRHRPPQTPLHQSATRATRNSQQTNPVPRQEPRATVNERNEASHLPRNTMPARPDPRVNASQRRQPDRNEPNPRQYILRQSAPTHAFTSNPPSGRSNRTETTVTATPTRAEATVAQATTATRTRLNDPVPPARMEPDVRPTPARRIIDPVQQSNVGTLTRDRTEHTTPRMLNLNNHETNTRTRALDPGFQTVVVNPRPSAQRRSASERPNRVQALNNTIQELSRPPTLDNLMDEENFIQFALSVIDPALLRSPIAQMIGVDNIIRMAILPAYIQHLENRQMEAVIALSLLESQAQNQSVPEPPKHVLMKNRRPTKQELTEGESCSICLCPYESTTSVVELKCHHAFHKDCLMPWFEEHHTCPICRTDIDEG